MQFTEPTHEISTFVSGPDNRGVSIDANFGKAGDT